MALPVLSAERLHTAYSYAAYRQLINERLTRGLTTGTTQSEALTHYARLNVQRMERIDKTVQVLPELLVAVQELPRPYVWLVLTEGWCGDAAQIVPTLEAVAQASQGQLSTRYLLRDENLDLMDRYLTNGGRAIPKLIMLDAVTLEEVAQWGPRPAPTQALFLELKAQGLSHEAYAEQVHAWYAKDKTRTTQAELLALVRQLG